MTEINKYLNIPKILFRLIQILILKLKFMNLYLYFKFGIEF